MSGLCERKQETLIGAVRYPTHHSTGSARKAAQAGEFKRYTSELLVSLT